MIILEIGDIFVFGVRKLRYRNTYVYINVYILIIIDSLNWVIYGVMMFYLIILDNLIKI